VAVTFEFAARTDIGLTRSNNQDSAYAGPHLLVVADGMGGHAGGDIASSVAIAHLAALDDENPGADDAAAEIDQSVAEAHDELLARVAEDPELAGLGTTITALLRTGDRLVLAHIGDSRAYLLRDEQLEQVTADHTFVQYLVDTGKLEPDQAERHPQRSLLLRVLGDVDLGGGLDISVRGAKIGDRWLLCSDGLSAVVSRDTIFETLSRRAEPGKTADRLIELALRAGGPDNVTCVVADVIDLDQVADGAAPATAVEVVGAAAADRNRPTRGGGGAAGRAAALAASAKAAQTPAPAADRKRRRRRRTAKTEEPEQEGDRELAGGRRPGSGRRRLIAAAVALAAVAALAGGGAAFYNWSQTQYYIAEAQGQVAVYQGIAQAIGPFELSHVERLAGVEVASLPQVSQVRLRGTLPAGSLAEAEAKLAGFLADAGPTSMAPGLPGPTGQTSPTSQTGQTGQAGQTDPVTPGAGGAG
jgi:protein phosphatase